MSLPSLAVALCWWLTLQSSAQANQESEKDHVRKPLPTPAEIRELPADGGPEYNRLIHEPSPYLLQHARNPVDWFPWGEEAFARAKAEDKPIFLSIGYSTCHWCHVMEHESFEDEQVAALMNESFICVKVDREERPDVDQVYMTVTQQLTGSGGWPMTVVMTPDKRPFFAGTYFPKSGRQGRAGMLELVPALAQAWKTRRDEVLKSATEIVAALARANLSTRGERPGPAALGLAFEQLATRYDTSHGGFGRAPKFPLGHNLRFLLRYSQREQNEDARQMVEHTLRAMRQGGIFDQVGFGFHRYSTDREWLLPHFEKMLYDQALLVMAYVEAAQLCQDADFESCAREVLTYVLRDMTSTEGGFYSAEDADSEGEEGLFYLWTPSELREVLGEKDGAFAIRIYNVAEGGNFLDQASGVKTGGNILHLRAEHAEIAREEGLPESELRERLERIRAKLYDRRKQRIHPLKDDKILTDWNGLMISALARAAAAFGDPSYAKAASKAADFILNRLRTPEGRLLKRYRGGVASGTGLLDDYAFFVAGLIDLYQASFELRYLVAALELHAQLREYFFDQAGGGFFLAPKDGEVLIVRPKESYDGALPSGNAIAAMNALRLARLTGDEEHAGDAYSVLEAFSSEAAQAPASMTELMLALDFDLGPTHEVVIVGQAAAPDTQAMLTALRRPFLPNMVVLLRPAGENEPALARYAPFVREQEAVGGRATAYVCRNFACAQPTTDVEAMLKMLLEPLGIRE